MEFEDKKIPEEVLRYILKFFIPKKNYPCIAQVNKFFYRLVCDLDTSIMKLNGELVFI